MRLGERTKVRAEGGHNDWTPAPGLPDLYIAMGQTAENVAEHKGVSRQAMDEYGVMSQNKAEAAIGRGFFEMDITPAGACLTAPLWPATTGRALASPSKPSRS